jgi:hypothetical protein
MQQLSTERMSNGFANFHLTGGTSYESWMAGTSPAMTVSSGAWYLMIIADPQPTSTVGPWLCRREYGSNCEAVEGF